MRAVGANSHPRIALSWTPEGKRKRGRPKETWRRTIEKERKKFGFESWTEAVRSAHDKGKWRGLNKSKSERAVRYNLLNFSLWHHAQWNLYKPNLMTNCCVRNRQASGLNKDFLHWDFIKCSVYIYRIPVYSRFNLDIFHCVNNPWTQGTSIPLK